MSLGSKQLSRRVRRALTVVGLAGLLALGSGCRDDDDTPTTITQPGGNGESTGVDGDARSGSSEAPGTGDTEADTSAEATEGGDGTGSDTGSGNGSSRVRQSRVCTSADGIAPQKTYLRAVFRSIPGRSAAIPVRPCFDISSISFLTWASVVRTAPSSAFAEDGHGGTTRLENGAM